MLLQDPKFCIIIRLLERKESKDDTLYEAGEAPNEIAILCRVTMEQIGHFARYFGTQHCRGKVVSWKVIPGDRIFQHVFSRLGKELKYCVFSKGFQVFSWKGRCLPL